MLFQLPEEIRKLKETAWEFLKKEIVPIAAERDSEGTLTREEIKKFGLMLKPYTYGDGAIPKEFGGLEQSFLTQVGLHEELARAWRALAVTLGTHSGITRSIAVTAPPELAKRIVPAAMEYDHLICDMMSEPESGSDTRNLKTTAVLDGDHYIVNGTKRWQTNGSIGDIGVLSAVVDPQVYAQNPRAGVIRLLVEKEVSPWEARELTLIGSASGPIGEEVFTNCRVPKENLMQPSSMGYQDALILRGWARTKIGSVAVGVMQAALDAAIEYAKRRVQFKRQIGGFQLIQAMIAEMIADVDTSRFLVYRAAELMDNGIRCDMEQSMAKAFASEAAMRVTDKAIQIHGALGLTRYEGYSTERYFRDARCCAIGEGTTEILKLVVARRALGIQAFV